MPAPLPGPASPPAVPATRVALVCAVVVTFEPDPIGLQALLARLAPQVAFVLVVDNASARQPPRLAGGEATLIPLPHNAGIAAAQNIGIRTAAELGAGFVLLMDQDSLPAADMVRQLLRAHDQAAASGRRVGAVGARIIDPEGRQEGFVRFRHGRYEAVPPTTDDVSIDCDMLISSGTLIPRAALDAIGGMAEDLFIDKVDTEWCLRAQAHGLRLLGAPHALLQHRLGDGSVRIWFGRWRQLRLHKPFRYYYMVRNGLLLRRSPHRTPAWCRADLRQLLSLVLYFGLLKPRGFAPLRMMLRGLVDGLRQVSGPLR
jgi:rhamnosyltransferase